jgi:regulator of protease activity HflC (stomatin/prohibitin superfamily)
MSFLIWLTGSFFFFLIGFPIFMFFVRVAGLYVIVRERTCHVYVLFGNVVGVIDEPGLHVLPLKLGLSAFVVNWLGRRHVVDLRLDQVYLRSQAVNSEEGAPMGVGIWYEMFVSNPEAFLFKNADPRGSLRANVASAAVRTLSNMPLDKMLENRHPMSRAVRDEVSPKSHEWGYQLGSIYIRKVHFRDVGMIQQIQEKVVNRLNQVTSAIQQDGANQVSIITSNAERVASVEFAKARAMRPRVVGDALQQIAAEPEVLQAVFEVLETQELLDAKGQVVLLPKGAGAWAPLLMGGRQGRT